jgi:hypothetical protein
VFEDAGGEAQQDSNAASKDGEKERRLVLPLFPHPVFPNATITLTTSTSTTLLQRCYWIHKINTETPSNAMSTT